MLWAAAWKQLKLPSGKLKKNIYISGAEPRNSKRPDQSIRRLPQELNATIVKDAIKTVPLRHSCLVQIPHLSLSKRMSALHPLFQRKCLSNPTVKTGLSEFWQGSLDSSAQVPLEQDITVVSLNSQRGYTHCFSACASWKRGNYRIPIKSANL